MRLVLLLAVTLALSSCEFIGSKPSVDLVVTPEGALFLNGNPIDEKDLAAALKAAHAQQPNAVLHIRIDDKATSRPPNLERVFKATDESGMTGSVTSESKEQEQARRWKMRRSESLFFGGWMLLAVCVVTPFALRAKTASSARNTAILGILGVGILIGVVIGAYMDYKSWSRGHGVWLVSVFSQIYFVPLSLVTGVITGSICALIVRRRTKAATPAP